MFIADKTNFVIRNPSELLNFSSQDIFNLKEMEKEKKISFSIPEKFKINSDKIIYKVGFLIDFLEILYPNENKSYYYKIINNKYSVYIGDRQMQRRYNQYKSNNKFQN